MPLKPSPLSRAMNHESQTSMQKRWIAFSFLLVLLLTSGCRANTLRKLPATLVVLPETKVQFIPITEPVSQPKAEISGMAWYADEWLIMLPQYPGTFTGDDDRGHIFALKKQDILDVLDGRRSAPIAPRVIAFVAPDTSLTVEGFEGYEAIAFRGDDAFLTIETKIGLSAQGYLVHALMAADMSSLTVDTSVPTLIQPQAELRNMSDEALFVAGDNLLSIYEINSDKLNAAPVAHRFGFDLQALPTIPFPNIDYRITDATALDSQGRFWAINYFTPADLFFAREDEPLMLQYGLGISHRLRSHVERLVEFQYNENGITRIDQPPLYLQLSAIEHNWEGIVRLDDRGFLLATDKFPGTLLGFVAKASGD